MEPPVQPDELLHGLGSQEELQVAVEDDEGARPVDLVERPDVHPLRVRILAINGQLGEMLNVLGREDDVFRVGEGDARLDELVGVGNPRGAKEDLLEGQHSWLK